MSPMRANGKPATSRSKATGPGGGATEGANLHFHCDRLVTARRRLGMNQGELARLLGVDQSTVSRLERGEMQSPPWKLVIQTCMHLQLEPHALLDTEPGHDVNSCRPVTVARSRVANHLLYLGSFGRVPEMLHYCLHDIGRTRPTVIGLSILLFDWPVVGTSRQYYAHWQTGQASFAERTVDPEEKHVAALLKRWRAGKMCERAGRPELVGWDPHLSVDAPMRHGMMGFDFMQEEETEGDTLLWVDRMISVFEVGMDMIASNGPTDAAHETREILVRLAELERRLL